MADLLLFRVGAGRFAAPLASVEEALDLPPDTVQAIPGENTALRGVFPLRGALVPLYDPHRALGVARRSAEVEGRVGSTAMVVRPVEGASRVAIAVDDVEDVLDDLLDEHILPPTGGMDLDGIVRGVAQRGAAIIVLVDLNALVAVCRATVGGERA